MTKRDKTARKMLPSIFRKVQRINGWIPGSVNLDVGGGPYQVLTESLADIGVLNLVWDPINRSHTHNTTVLFHLSGAQCDTATISNVLCVVPDIKKRLEILRFAKQHVKGRIFITVYEGNKSGVGGPTRDGYQLNRRLRDYLSEVRIVFPRAEMCDGMIVAHPDENG